MTPHVDKACMRRVRPCKMRSARHSEPVLLLQDITVEIKNLLLRGSAYNIALGQSKLRIDAQFAAQPGRQKALALLMDRTHVDIVMATRSSSGEVTWQHTGALPFSIDKDSPGFVALLAALTASSAGTGRQEYDPPAHQLRDYRYTGTKQGAQIPGQRRASWGRSISRQVTKHSGSLAHSDCEDCGPQCSRSSDPEDWPNCIC